jgi:hypothetical protein
MPTKKTPAAPAQTVTVPLDDAAVAEREHAIRVLLDEKAALVPAARAALGLALRRAKAIDGEVARLCREASERRAEVPAASAQLGLSLDAPPAVEAPPSALPRWVVELLPVGAYGWEQDNAGDEVSMRKHYKLALAGAKPGESVRLLNPDGGEAWRATMPTPAPAPPAPLEITDATVTLVMRADDHERLTATLDGARVLATTANECELEWLVRGTHEDTGVEIVFAGDVATADAEKIGGYLEGLAVWHQVLDGGGGLIVERGDPPVAAPPAPKPRRQPGARAQGNAAPRDPDAELVTIALKRKDWLQHRVNLLDGKSLAFNGRWAPEGNFRVLRAPASPELARVQRFVAEHDLAPIEHDAPLPPALDPEAAADELLRTAPYPHVVLVRGDDGVWQRAHAGVEKGSAVRVARAALKRGAVVRRYEGGVERETAPAKASKPAAEVSA